MADSEGRARPSVTVDIVVVAFRDGQLEVLLVNRKKPPNEPLESAARRELWEETGLESVRLEQLHTFGDPGRDPRGWTISVAYLGLLEEQEAEAWRPRAGSDAGAAGWFDLDHLPALAFDHADILGYARMVLGSREQGLVTAESPES
jgi:8-oxo-dGTP diphosphatase